jgi:hypothetical protein
MNGTSSTPADAEKRVGFRRAARVERKRDAARRTREERTPPMKQLSWAFSVNIDKEKSERKESVNE